MKIEKIQKLKNNKYKIKLDSGDIINTYDDVILNNSLLFNKEIDLELLNKINEVLKELKDSGKIDEFIINHTK